MKLASLKFGRDGRLVVVSDDLAWYADATHIAPTMQSALDDWDAVAPALELLATDLAHDVIPKERFHERAAAAPLPRAFQWIRSGAGNGGQDTALHRGGSDKFMAARDDITLFDEAWGCDLCAAIIVVTGDVPQGVTLAQAAGYIRLVGVANDISLRHLTPSGGEDPARTVQANAVQAKSGTAFSPVFVTPSSLGDLWQNGSLMGTVMTDVNGAPFGRLVAPRHTASDFGALIAHLAKTRSIGAGSIIGSELLLNHGVDGNAGAVKSITEGGLGFGCIAELQNAEIQVNGHANTPFLKWGDSVRIEMRDDHGHSIFGAIEQIVTAG